MEQKHNKQLHTQEYSIEYSAHDQQLIYEVISGMFLEYSSRYTRALLQQNGPLLVETCFSKKGIVSLVWGFNISIKVLTQT